MSSHTVTIWLLQRPLKITSPPPPYPSVDCLASVSHELSPLRKAPPFPLPPFPPRYKYSVFAGPLSLFGLMSNSKS